VALQPSALVVCPIVPHPPQSGGQKRTLRLLETMERAGLRPHVVSSDVSRAEGADVLRRRGWAVDLVAEPPVGLAARLDQHRRRLPSPYLDRVAQRVDQLAAGPVALLQLEHTQSAYYWPDGISTILSLHNLDSALLQTVVRAQPKWSIARLRALNRLSAMRDVERRAFRKADDVLCVTDEDAAHVAERGGRAVVAPNGVDDDLFAVPPNGAGRRVVLFFGRLDYGPNEAGLLRFLRDGWPRVHDARPDARLRVAGAGAGPRLAQAAATTSGVDLVGVVPDIAAELAQCTVTVVPVWQGAGTRLKVLEALAAARPVVGTPLGVAGTGFADGRHGVVAASPEGLADGVLALLGDLSRAGAAGRAGREHAERWRWSKTLASAEELYRRRAAAMRASTPELNLAR
jgi:glycosyltransferase involved in cell wall biosynthesis